MSLVRRGDFSLPEAATNRLTELAAHRADEAWSEYRRGRSVESRNVLVECYMYLVRRAATPGKQRRAAGRKI